MSSRFAAMRSRYGRARMPVPRHKEPVVRLAQRREGEDAGQGEESDPEVWEEPREEPRVRIGGECSVFVFGKTRLRDIPRTVRVTRANFTPVGDDDVSTAWETTPLQDTVESKGLVCVLPHLATTIDHRRTLYEASRAALLKMVHALVAEDEVYGFHRGTGRLLELQGDFVGSLEQVAHFDVLVPRHRSEAGMYSVELNSRCSPDLCVVPVACVRELAIQVDHTALVCLGGWHRTDLQQSYFRPVTNHKTDLAIYVHPSTLPPLRLHLTQDGELRTARGVGCVRARRLLSRPEQGTAGTETREAGSPGGERL